MGITFATTPALGTATLVCNQAASLVVKPLPTSLSTIGKWRKGTLRKFTRKLWSLSIDLYCNKQTDDSQSLMSLASLNARWSVSRKGKKWQVYRAVPAEQG